MLLKKHYTKVGTELNKGVLVGERGHPFRQSVKRKQTMSVSPAGFSACVNYPSFNSQKRGVSDMNLSDEEKQKARANLTIAERLVLQGTLAVLSDEHQVYQGSKVFLGK